MIKIIIASLAGLTFTTYSFAAEEIVLDNITVTANRFEHKDTETTYASELHNAGQIAISGAATLYDYLAQQTSLNILSNIGNKATPSINLRGFGNENGYQNVAITVDGQRINSIDLTPALLASIPLSNIERIEISKGSGSVIYGDGATAGTIQIYTKNKTGVTFSSSFGNYGQQNHHISAGISEKIFDISANLAHDSHDGYSNTDNTGHRDSFDSNNQNAKLKFKPTDQFRIFIEATNSKNDVRYVSPLTLAQFNQAPKTAIGRFTHQTFDSTLWQLGAEYDITPEFQFRAVHFDEDKFSQFISATPSHANSRYKSNDFSLRLQHNPFNLLVGFQDFSGERHSFSDFGFGPSTDITTKKNLAVYVQGEYFLNAWTFSAGARNENVKYNFEPIINPFATLSGKDNSNIDAFDLGINYRFNDNLSAFANINQAYQAPDIDRLFNFSGGFNGFIEPAKVQTLNIGLNQNIKNHRLKLTGYYAKLHNEIYLVPIIFSNTNIDSSHKYGLEIQDYWQINDTLSASAIYNYTRAIIDHENESNGQYSGKQLPGAPKNSIVANLNWQFYEHAMLNLNHTWRSQAYAYNDFANNFSQKQQAYETTNMALNYQYQNYTLFAAINNIFEHKNSIQIQDNSLYPVDFVRTWHIGMKADF